MQPTPQKLVGIIEFVMNQSQVIDALAKREKNTAVCLSSITCRFVLQNGEPLHNSVYDVTFGYRTTTPTLENYDDILFRVAVWNEESPKYKILMFKEF